MPPRQPTALPTGRPMRRRPMRNLAPSRRRLGSAREGSEHALESTVRKALASDGTPKSSSGTDTTAKMSTWTLIDNCYWRVVDFRRVRCTLANDPAGIRL